jgi:hypothetical protein
VKHLDWKEACRLVILLLLVTWLWNTWLVYPLKILVVFFHEFSHASAAWLTGGKVVEIKLQAAQGGHCITVGGHRFAVLSAGYLGSLLWGGGILVLASRYRLDKGATMALGVLLVVVTVWLVRPVLHFGFAFGMLSGIALLAAGRALPQQANEVLLKVIGLTSCLYAVLDIKSDILDRPHLRSDAYMLAEHTGLPTLFWGLLWLGAALLLSWQLLLIACRKQGGA